MPRYFFNLTNDIRTVVDADGVQLEDEEAMRLEALEMVTGLREEAHITGMDWSGWRVIALAVTTVMRSEALPQIPTVSDFVPGFEAGQGGQVLGC
jgi:hypothetical protein